MIDEHAHWFHASPMSEKEFMMASAESWKENEVKKDVTEMNRWRPFYLYLRKLMVKKFGGNFIDERNRMIKDDPVKYVGELLSEAGIKGIVIDEGFGRKVHEIPIPVKRLFRIENIIGDLFSMSFDRALETFKETLRRKVKKEDYAGFKSIIAYRTGLPSSCDEGSALRDFHSGEHEWYGRRAKGFRDFLFCVTMEEASHMNVPFQVHTGAGDRDIKLNQSMPSILTDMVRTYEGTIVFVHAGYPFHRETAWMSYLFPSVYLDVSQVFPFAPLGGYHVLSEVLEVAPFTKVMYGSDAFEIPEIAWASASLFRSAISKVTEELEEIGVLSSTERKEVEEMISFKNAERIYGRFNT
ncbi:amidohydrolase family protein [Sulfuracidifex tepidarius]|uniref:amidohydrolase family protein n=1 Tax=Sulfuracidifex tepidarius TaxID=1294262 RepID=UPI00210A185F|nr:amidohydrolase family protein [Sulfuracidifex tepidarius]